MRFVRTVFWLAVIALAVQGLVRNGRHLERLYEESQTLAQIRNSRPDGRWVRADFANLPAPAELSAAGFPGDRKCASGDGAIIDEIVALRERLGRPPVAEILVGLALPGDNESRPDEEKGRRAEQAELFREALRQIPASGLYPPSGCDAFATEIGRK